MPAFTSKAVKQRHVVKENTIASERGNTLDMVLSVPSSPV